MNFADASAQRASDLVRAEKWKAAAMAFDDAVGYERRAKVPDLSKINRWKTAAERCRENAEAPESGW